MVVAYAVVEPPGRSWFPYICRFVKERKENLIFISNFEFLLNEQIDNLIILG